MAGRIAVTKSAGIPVRSVTLEAVVTRADGSTEDHGTIAHWDRSWWRRLAWNLRNGRN